MLKLKAYRQSRNHCGPSSLRIVLAYYGLEKSERWLAKLTKSSHKHGTHGHKIVEAAKKLGFKAFLKDNAEWKDIENLVVKKRIPVIVEWFSPFGQPDGHYSPIAWITKKHIIIQDPEIGRKRKLCKAHFMRLWFDFEKEPLKFKRELTLRRIIAIYC